MSDKAVRLEIMQSWWLWRGFWPSGRDVNQIFCGPELEHGFPRVRYRDPMDTQNFKEEEAFPLLKPSIDTFGVPHRSRAQRGWYQIRSPARPVAPPHIAAYHHEATAADLPPELVSRIAESVSGSRSALVSCARVCRHWANILQPKLFRRIMLRSLRESNQLLSIRRASLTGLIHEELFLTLEAQLRDPPFIHRISHMKHLSGARATITGPLPAPCGSSVRSVLGGVPRALPRSSLAHIRNLTLEDVNFRSFMDFMDLVAELPPSMVIFRAVRLTWRKEVTWPDVPRRYASARHRVSQRCIYLDHCMPGQRWLVLLLLGYQRVPSEFGALVRQVEEQLGDVQNFAVDSSGYGREICE